MNYHDDKWIMEKVQEHYDEALVQFPKERIVCVALHGSQNYGLDVEDSDVDTKLIITPTFQDLAMNRQASSYTHVRENNEHIDIKDVRLYLQTFRKQNLNFLEILFTPYTIINPLYEEQWNRLRENRELITHYAPQRSVSSMVGVAMNKWSSLEKDTPARHEIVKKYGYDPKQLMHLLRIEEFLEGYVNRKSYKECLLPCNRNYLITVKQGKYIQKEARKLAEISIQHCMDLEKEFIKQIEADKESYTQIKEEAEDLLNSVQYEIMKIAIKNEEDLK